MNDLKSIEQHLKELRQALKKGNVKLARVCIECLIYNANCLQTDLDLRAGEILAIYKER